MVRSREHREGVRLTGPAVTVGPLPNFCVIGAMRSGTTSLARYLGAHPEIFMAPTKEVRYFDRYFDRGLDWYRLHFREATSEPAIGEATPYMHDRASIRRMAEVLPDLRLIAILRNPVDRAYSHYWMRRALGHDASEFAESVGPELAGLLGAAPTSRYLRWGRYLEQLTQVCELYPRDKLHVLVLEELRAAPQRYGEVCGFLGVDDTFLPPNLGRAVNPHVRFRSRRLRRLTKRLPRSAGRVVARINTVGSAYPPMDPALRAKLIRYFEPANEELSAWLGMDLSLWSK